MYKYMAPTLLAVLVLLLSLVEAQQPTPTPPVPAPQTNCQVSTTHEPKVGLYNLTSCIVAQLAGSIQVGPNQYIDIVNGTVNPAKSHCDNSTSQQEPQITIDFSCGSLSLNIGHGNDSSTFVSGISGLYHLNNKTVTFNNSTKLFSTTLSGHYYKCNAEQAILVATNLTVEPKNATLLISSLAIEAYRTVPGTDFYQIVEECSLDSQPVSDLVRIGVGICLVALVAIVLVAYFIGRRRWSERSSYESV